MLATINIVLTMSDKANKLNTHVGAYTQVLLNCLADFFSIWDISNYTLYALGLDLVLVGFAFSVSEPMWDMKYVFPRLILVFLLLIMPLKNDKISLN
ncbi:MAG TPA: hypothetical protein VN026_00795 [Bacteroidia bacterium]|jgi:hypothetical protein|nr:hypothetical protein [Bacteroidia bacterium]